MPLRGWLQRTLSRRRPLVAAPRAIHRRGRPFMAFAERTPAGAEVAAVNDEAAFLDALRADPTDAALLLVYADWLEERGDLRAEYIRLIQEPQRNESRIEVLRQRLDLSWVALIDELAAQAIYSRAAAELIQFYRAGKAERSHDRPSSLALERRPSLGRSFLGIIVVGVACVGTGLGLLLTNLGDLLLFGLVLILVGAVLAARVSYTFLRFRRALHSYQQRRAQIAARLRNQPPV